MIKYTNISWLQKNASLEVLFNEVSSPCTAVFAFIFSEDKKTIFLMDNANRERGLDIPGGHIDAGETPIEALHREILEEVGLSVKNVSFVGCQRITKDVPEEKYPDLVSCQNFYTAVFNKIETEQLEKDSLSRIEVNVDAFIAYFLNNKDCYYKELFFKALEV